MSFTKKSKPITNETLNLLKVRFWIKIWVHKMVVSLAQAVELAKSLKKIPNSQ